MKQNKNVGNLSRIKVELERRLIVMRYSETTTRVYMRIFGWVEDYLKGYGESNYTKELGQRFIVEYSLQSNHVPGQYRSARTLIRRLDEILENKMFAPCYRDLKWECPSRFVACRDKYIANLSKRGFRLTSINSRKLYSGRLLSRLPDSVQSIEELTAEDIYHVLTKHEWPHTGLIIMKGFLSYLFESGTTQTDLSLCVPKSNRPKPLPSVYSGDEIARLLSAVNRASSIGKRDYAILLIASHMGLRSSDIVNLSLADIDYDTKSIDIVQVKTARPVTLVMNGEVEEAITDYIKTGRPHSTSGKIFLGSQAPYAPLTAASGHAIANRYFTRCGIAAQGRERGIHALRTSYATALVSKGVPYIVVQEALGHEDPESAKYYVRVDVRRLRTCALEVPMPTGAFAVLLGDLEGVL